MLDKAIKNPILKRRSAALGLLYDLNIWPIPINTKVLAIKKGDNRLYSGKRLTKIAYIKPGSSVI